MKNLIFHNAADDSYMNTVENFRGAYAATQTVDLYFESPISGSMGANAYDKITLACTNGEEDRAIEELANAMTRNANITVIADDVNSVYACQNITSVTSITLAGKAVNSVVESVTGNDTLTAADSGKTFVFADAAAVLTLPDSGGGDIIGWTAKFISNFQGTGQEVICADVTNEVMLGGVVHVDTDDDTVTKGFAAEVADGFSSIEITGTTEGEPGSLWTLTCIAADRWIVEGVMQSAGTSATPFAAS